MFSGEDFRAKNKVFTLLAPMQLLIFLRRGEVKTHHIHPGHQVAYLQCFGNNLRIGDPVEIFMDCLRRSSEVQVLN